MSIPRVSSVRHKSVSVSQNLLCETQMFQFFRDFAASLTQGQIVGAVMLSGFVVFLLWVNFGKASRL